MGDQSALLFVDGILTPHALGDDRAADVLMAAAQRVSGAMRTSDVLYAVIERADPALLSTLDLALAEGAQLRHLLEAIDAYSPVGAESHTFDGSRKLFRPELLAALDAFADEFSADPEELRPVCLELLVACVLANPEAADHEFLGILDIQEAERALRQQIRLHSEPLPSLWDESSGRLLSEEFSADAWSVLEAASDRAAQLGYGRLLSPHCFLALLAETEGLTERLVRLQLAPDVGPARAVELVGGAFRLSDRRFEPQPRLHCDDLGETFKSDLRRAQKAAAVWGFERIDTPHLLNALLADPPQRLVSVLRNDPLRIDLERMGDHLREALREARTAAPREVPYKLPSSLPPAEDLTWLARTEGIAPAHHLDRYFDQITRALHRTTDNHVVITGLPGVGTTTLLRELARRAAADEIPFLRRKRFLRVDCRDVAAADSDDALTGIINHVQDRTDLVVCVDGLGALLRGPNGIDHLLTLRGALKEQRIHLIGVLPAHEYEDLLATDQVLHELMTRVDVTEPDRASAQNMVRQAAGALAAEFGVSVSPRAVNRAVVLSGDFILNQRLPLAAVKVLRRACEDLAYDRTQLGDTRTEVGTDEVVRVIAKLSGVPEGQIAGTGEGIDYERALGAEVVGQEEAVRTVANELRRIKAGLAGAGGGPASVMLFAGLTGVGKTELAKTIAAFYSASKRLQTYPMENFTEPHSVSGILGSPPGYVGHERGGRLINELNADPYCVFLLDEAEKAHPEVLRPFLNLFDEGWINDQRGVKAHGDRAIFILTTNAGHELISEMSEGHTSEEIADEVRKTLPTLRSRRGGEPVFSPELLARIRRVIVFRPLDEAALEGIGRRLLEQQRTFWLDKREKELVVPERVLRYAAKVGHARNRSASGREGGRIMRKLLSDLVETPVLLAAEERPEEFRRCTTIVVDFGAQGSEVLARFEHLPPAAGDAESTDEPEERT